MSERLTKTLGPRFAALAGSVRLGVRITFRVRGCESDSIREGEVVTITMRGVVAFDEGKQWPVKWRNVVAVGAPNESRSATGSAGQAPQSGEAQAPSLFAAPHGSANCKRRVRNEAEREEGRE